ncbi:MAG: MBL fold metallo-hydrolase [Chloroflexi bacterium]|nr:MBL fold metallo-hydrolase [Chloroflexota bacterium]
MSIKITTLSENTAGPGVLAEWGLSILVEGDGVRILLDTSQSVTVAHNAKLLNVDLSGIDKLVISHGHYDHTGGFKDVLAQTGALDVVAHPDMWTEKYAIYGDFQRYIGIPFAREELESLGASFQLTKDPVWITDNIVTTGEIPMTNDYEQIDAGMFIKVGDSFEPDQLLDDLALGIKTEAGLVIVLGCGHRGMINTIGHLQKVTGEQRVYGVLGGTHLVMANPERLTRTTADLRQIGVQKLGVSHCTGFNASCWLANEFPDEFFMNNSGTALTLP